MPLEQWRRDILKPNLAAKWDKLDELYSLVISALRDDLASDVDQASERLASIDPVVERGFVTRAIVQLKLGRTDDAGVTLRRAISKVGETGTLLTNKAKVIAAKGDHPAAMATLERGLRLDPNQDNGLSWRIAETTKAAGSDAAQGYLLELAALPHAWRPQLLLGQREIKAGRREESLDWFDQALTRAPHGSDVMLVVSGELGKHGLISDAVQRIAPIYDEHRDDIRAGYNLLQAYVELGDVTTGRALLDRLFAIGQPAYSEHLQRYAKTFDDMIVAPPQPLQHEPEISIAQMALPPWLLGMCDMAWAAPPRRESRQRVVLLPLSATGESAEERASSGREDERGRLSRALPLLLLEQLIYCSDLETILNLPVADGHNLVLFECPVSDEELEHLAEDFAFAVEGEIAKIDGDFNVIYRLRRLEDLAVLTRVERRFTLEGSGDALVSLTGELLAGLAIATSTSIEPRVPLYTLPAAHVTQYVSALGQVLALTLVDSPSARKRLFGERNIYSWLQTLAVSLPTSEPAQFMYFTALAKGRRFRSPILNEFERPAVQRMRELQRAGSYSARLLPLMVAVYPDNDELFDMLSSAKPAEDDAYAAWCGRIAGTFPARPVGPSTRSE